jgi:hypothetical protein
MIVRSSALHVCKATLPLDETGAALDRRRGGTAKDARDLLPRLIVGHGPEMTCPLA